MLVGYQSTEGKRVVFRSRVLGNGAVLAEAAHLHKASGRIETLMGRIRASIDGATKSAYLVAGVDLSAALATRFDNRAPNNALRAFMKSVAGRAYAEAVPAIFAAAEDINPDPALSKLYAPFGATLTALQLLGQTRHAADHLSHVIGTDAATALQAKCGGRECRYRGNRFTVHQDGLFDSFSKGAGKPKIGKSTGVCTPQKSSAVNGVF